MEVTKGPGWDWEIAYEKEGEAPDTMLVFGCIKIEEAIDEARLSLTSSELFGIAAKPYAILGARRLSGE